MEENSRVSPFIFIWQKKEAGHRKAILANLDWINFGIFLRVREILVQTPQQKSVFTAERNFEGFDIESS